jgi:flagellar biosynthesis component FlhA
MLLGSKYKTLLAMPFLKTLQIVFLFEKLYPYFGMASSSSPLFFFMSQMYFCTLKTETEKKQQKKTEKKNKNQNSKTEKDKKKTQKKHGRA